jgi:DNA-binding MarR family transcriptional regulator
MSLQAEIKQTRPFSSAYEEAFLNVWRTAEVLFYGVNETLKPHGLTLTQYNALRILRGAHPNGLTCGDIGGRMITRDPDVTRLGDRLEKRGLIARARDTADRRVVTTRITPAGLELMARLEAPMRAAPRRGLEHMSESDLRQLIALLERARTSSSTSSPKE